MKKILPILFFSCLLSIAAKGQAYSTVSTFAGNSSPGLLNGGLATAMFNGPYGVCSDDATGTIYVADALNHCIRKISNGLVSTLAGNGSPGDVDAQGSAARFNGPCGICFSNGYIYITDNGNNKIKRIDTLGNVSTFAGSGTAGYQDGSVTSAKFNNPVNLIADNSGYILVADYGNNCIRHILNGQVLTYAGLAGGGGDQLGSAASALFNRPTGLAMDAQNNLYVSDQVNGKIKKISGGIVSLVAGSGANSSVDGTGASASFYRPTYMDIDLYGNIIVAEWITCKIRRVSPSGVVSSLAGTGNAGYTNGPVGSATFDTPYGVCVNAAGDLYIGDKLNNVIRKITVSDVGVQEQMQSAADILQLTIFPNPVKDNISIVIPDGFGARRVLIYTATGALVRTETPAEKSITLLISVAELAPGQYFIFLEGDKSRAQGVFIRE